jgi:predicted Fe-Mo cluster-binding NifX family protein
MNFFKDLHFGNSYEKKLVKFLKPQLHAYNDDNEYDVLTVKDGKITRYEVKSDRLMNKTGNICMEFECNNRPSGISVSKANIYAYYEVCGDAPEEGTSGDKLYLIPKTFINEMINKKKYKTIINGGDGKRAKSYLFSKEVFSEFKMSLS